MILTHETSALRRRDFIARAGLTAAAAFLPAADLKDASGKLAAVPFAQRAAIVEAFRVDARVLRGWLGMPAS